MGVNETTEYVEDHPGGARRLALNAARNVTDIFTEKHVLDQETYSCIIRPSQDTEEETVKDRLSKVLKKFAHLRIGFVIPEVQPDHQLGPRSLILNGYIYDLTYIEDCNGRPPYRSWLTPSALGTLRQLYGQDITELYNSETRRGQQLREIFREVSKLKADVIKGKIYRPPTRQITLRELKHHGIKTLTTRTQRKRRAAQWAKLVYAGGRTLAQWAHNSIVNREPALWVNVGGIGGLVYDVSEMARYAKPRIARLARSVSGTMIPSVFANQEEESQEPGEEDGADAIREYNAKWIATMLTEVFAARAVGVLVEDPPGMSMREQEGVAESAGESEDTDLEEIWAYEGDGKAYLDVAGEEGNGEQEDNWDIDPDLLSSHDRAKLARRQNVTPSPPRSQSTPGSRPSARVPTPGSVLVAPTVDNSAALFRPGGRRLPPQRQTQNNNLARRLDFEAAPAPRPTNNPQIHGKRPRSELSEIIDGMKINFNFQSKSTDTSSSSNDDNDAPPSPTAGKKGRPRVVRLKKRKRPLKRSADKSSSQPQAKRPRLTGQAAEDDVAAKKDQVKGKKKTKPAEAAAKAKADTGKRKPIKRGPAGKSQAPASVPLPRESTPVRPGAGAGAVPSKHVTPGLIGERRPVATVLESNENESDVGERRGQKRDRSDSLENSQQWLKEKRNQGKRARQLSTDEPEQEQGGNSEDAGDGQRDRQRPATSQPQGRREAGTGQGQSHRQPPSGRAQAAAPGGDPPSQPSSQGSEGRRPGRRVGSSPHRPISISSRESTSSDDDDGRSPPRQPAGRNPKRGPSAPLHSPGTARTDIIRSPGRLIGRRFPPQPQTDHDEVENVVEEEDNDDLFGHEDDLFGIPNEIMDIDDDAQPQKAEAPAAAQDEPNPEQEAPQPGIPSPVRPRQARIKHVNRAPPVREQPVQNCPIPGRGKFVPGQGPSPCPIRRYEPGSDDRDQFTGYREREEDRSSAEGTDEDDNEDHNTEDEDDGDYEDEDGAGRGHSGGSRRSRGSRGSRGSGAN